MRVIILLMVLFSVRVCAAPVSINMHRLDLAKAVRLLAGYANINVVVDPGVHGEATLHVKNANPHGLLQSLMLTHGLGKIVMGDVWYVALHASLIKMQQQAEQWRVQFAATAPLVSRSWRIQYAKASDIASVIQGGQAKLISQRGQLKVDERTNIIFMRDIAEHITVVDKLVRKLDVPVKQVLIEARLASVDTDAEQQLGVEFATRHDGKQLASPSRQQGRFSFSVARLAGDSSLDVTLSALEREGRAELISSPSLFTGSQQEASIEAGEEVPYQEVSKGGGTAVAFKKAVLGLKVTPQVLPGNKVMLMLKINQDRPSSRMIQGVPAISTRQITTNVIVNNGQTIVLGGIYEINHERGKSALPFLGKIPIIGLLFTQRNTRDNKRELLIFVTPRIKDV